MHFRQKKNKNKIYSNNIKKSIKSIETLEITKIPILRIDANQPSVRMRLPS